MGKNNKEKKIPPILLVSLPKSASIYIWKGLSTGLNIPQVRIAAGIPPNQYLFIYNLKEFSKGNGYSQRGVK